MFNIQNVQFAEYPINKKMQIGHTTNWMICELGTSQIRRYEHIGHKTYVFNFIQILGIV